MTEAKFQTEFTKWAKHNLRRNTAIELKIVNGERFSLSDIREQQWICLKNAKSRTLAYKIPDAGISQKPFDMFVLSGADAYVAIMFYSRGEREFFMFDIDTMLRFKEDGMKSFTKKDAFSLADRVERLA